MSGKTVTGINIQFPISRLIVDGKKTIETRTYPIPEHYLGKEMAIIETPGKAGNFEARVIGLITFERCFKYNDAKAFYADTERHQVTEDSPWCWTADKEKWGWEIKRVKKFAKPKVPPKRKGIVYTKDVSI
jgi:hypothetical protein